jgi:hypothetical protein
MAPGGLYNRHARVQSSAAVFAGPLLQRAAQEASLPPAGEAVVFADYGCATGRNSNHPAAIAIRALRAREDRPVLVVHEDQPENDFATLFGTIEAEPDGYLRMFDRVSACAVGRSFYQPTLPAGFVSVGWSSAAAHWLSRVPTPLPGHLWAPTARSAQGAAFSKQARDDWARFLALRADELRVGGRLVIVVATVDQDGICGGEQILDGLNRAVQELVAAGALSSDDYASMVVPCFFLSEAELEAPFHREDLAGRLHLIEHARTVSPDPLWSAFETTGDREALASAFTGWVRGFSEPCLFGSLELPPTQRRALADQAYAALEREIRSHPENARCAWRSAALLVGKR